MAAKQATCWDAGIQPQDIVAFLASVTGRRGQLQEAGVVGAPSRAWDVKEKDRLCSSCIRMTKLGPWQMMASRRCYLKNSSLETTQVS